MSKIFFYFITARILRRGVGRKLEKLVVKTAVKTALIILGVLIVVFAVFNFAFPQHMATVAEGIGNYNIAVKYASLRYTYTRSGEDLARCFDDSVFLGNDDYIIEYGEKLKNRDDFQEICENTNEKVGGGYDYEHRVYGKLSVSYYNKGRKEEAVALAYEANGTDSFAYGNALMSLSSVARSAKDAATCSLIIEKLDSLNPVKEEEIKYVKEVRTSLRTVVASYGG